MKYNVVIIFSILTIASGCSWGSSVPVIPSDERVDSDSQQESTVSSTHATDTIQKNSIEKLIPSNDEKHVSVYTDTTYGFQFQYPTSWSLRVSDGKESRFLALDTEDGQGISEIEVRYLSADDWEKPEYAQVTSFNPVFVYDEKRYGYESWLYYYIKDTKGNLYHVGCVAEECDMTLSNLTININRNAERDYTTTMDQNIGPPPSFLYIDDPVVLVGTWRVIDGEDYDSIIMQSDNVFRVVKENKELYQGTWDLTDGHLTLSTRDAMNTYYVTGYFEGDTLYWENDSDVVAMWQQLH